MVHVRMSRPDDAGAHISTRRSCPSGVWKHEQHITRCDAEARRDYGMAEQCSGLPGQPTHQIKVIVYRDHRVVAHQAKLGSHAYRFSLPPGQYEVTSTSPTLSQPTFHCGRAS